MKITAGRRSYQDQDSELSPRHTGTARTYYVYKLRVEIIRINENKFATDFDRFNDWLFHISHVAPRDLRKFSMPVLFVCVRVIR